MDPGGPAALTRRSTSTTVTDWLEPIGKAHPRDVAAGDLDGFRKDLASTQGLLYASNRYALLVVLQALDAAGKDGTIKHVMSGVNPQGCSVVSFRQPSREELSHDFLWRCSKALPALGRIGIFNRSYYEDVLVTRVHPELLMQQPPSLELTPGSELWAQRHEDINGFERHLHRNGTRIVKLFLHISKDEQKRRLLQRIDTPEKQWKFSSSDLSERSHFTEYESAYEDTLSATSTPWAPWYVIPADHKYAARALVGCIVAHTIGELDLRLPDVSPEGLVALRSAREELLAE